MYNFDVPSGLVYGDRRALQNGCNKFGDFLETFLPEGAKIFHRGLFEGPLEMYLLIVQGHHLCHLVEGRWRHGCITIPLKKSMLIPYHEKGGLSSIQKTDVFNPSVRQKLCRQSPGGDTKTDSESA